MKHRERTAFTLIEVLLALGVLATSMAILSSLQTKSIFRVLYGREEIDRVFLIKQRLYSLLIKPTKLNRPKKERLEEPEMSIETTTFSIPRKSSLFDLRTKLMAMSTTGKWLRAGREQTMRMVSFVFNAKEEKKE